MTRYQRLYALYLLAWAVIGLLVIVLCYSLAGCVVRPVPTDTEDNKTLCAPACENMKRLYYPGWQGSPGEDEDIATEADNVPCHLVCEATLAAGFPFHSGCLAEAKTSADMDSCYD